MPLLAQVSKKPRVILGLMTFGPDPAHGARITTQDGFKEVLDLLQSRGYNEVDTARMYAKRVQEAWTRDAGWKERGLTLATKVLYPASPGANGKEGVRDSVETSLKELGTDCIDILYLHAADRATPFAETLSEINALHKEGKFVRFGLSNFTSFEVAEICLLCAHNNWVRPTIYQGMYNLLCRNLEKELIPACRRYGIELVVYNPIAGGLLSGKIKSKDLVPAGGRFSDVAWMGKMYRDRYFKESVFEALKLVEAAVEVQGDGTGMAEMALRWCVHHSDLHVLGGANGDGVIIGVSSKEQLNQNLDALEKGPLKEETVELLAKAWAVSMKDAPDYWHLELKYGYDTVKEVFGPKI